VPALGETAVFSIWDQTNATTRPVNKEELFNLRHASARNVIERIFGVLKRRFRILLLSPEYKMQIQARIPAALCALHNYITINDPNEGTLPQAAVVNDNPSHQGQPDEATSDDMDTDADASSSANSNALRDDIATQMWNDYQIYMQERDEVLVDDDDENTLDLDEIESEESDFEQDVDLTE
jgi:hypothetical protein